MLRKMTLNEKKKNENDKLINYDQKCCYFS